MKSLILLSLKSPLFGKTITNNVKTHLLNANSMASLSIHLDKSILFTNKTQSHLSIKPSILFLANEECKYLMTNNKTNLYCRFYSTNVQPPKSEQENIKNSEETKSDDNKSNKSTKKESRFKKLYTQYGPLFIVVHLTTVVLWIYGFFLISKQGYDITQLLNLFVKLNMMSEETVKKIHYKIDNYKTESQWITGQNIKHFATAYMVYKVIAPFRYMVSIALVRYLVRFLRSQGLLKK